MACVMYRTVPLEDSEWLNYEERRQKSSTSRWLLACLAVFLLAATIGFLIGWFSHQASAVSDLARDADPAISAKLFNEIKADNIRNYLREYTRFPHMSGTEEERRLEDMLVTEWEGQGLHQVVKTHYTVLLSFPNTTDPSFAEILDDKNQTVHRTAPGEDVVMKEQEEQTVPLPFNSYAKAGDFIGDPIYVHTCTETDLIRLRDDLKVDLNGKIFIARYGSSYRGDKVKFAAKYGAAAVLLYLDPQENVNGTQVFPHSEWLPGSAVQRGTVLSGMGDPLTPRYPSTDSAYRVLESKWLPTIPSYPISYNDAYKFLSEMGGESAPSDWQGGFNLTYRLGPGLQSNRKMRVKVTNYNKLTNITNVFAFINGTIEPDRYVLLGNHRDAWTFGGVDPTSGTAAMMELSRVFMKQVNNGWRPRRTIIFCSWGAEEFGLIGSTEWVEDYVRLLSSRAVAYLNVDYVAEYNVAPTAGSMPTLRDVIYSAAKKVDSPRHGGKTMYDDWLATFPSSDYPNTPQLDSLGDSSDFAGFLLIAGISCYDFWYTSQANAGYPLYHTAYDSFDLVNNFIDPGFVVSRAVTQFWAETVRSLTDSHLLPLNVSHYATVLFDLVHTVDSTNSEFLALNNITLDQLKSVSKSLREEAANFHQRLKYIDTNNVLAVRTANDQMLALDRAFIDQNGLPSRPAYRHVVYAPSLYDSYEGVAFPGLTDLLYEIRSSNESQGEKWEQFKEHLAAIIHCFNSARAVLRPPQSFIN